MTAINNRLNAVAEFGDVVPACVVSLCGEAAAEIARLQAQVDALAGALWVTTEHNALHFGEKHNTVIHGRAAISSAGR